jgi:hypothetical protein
VLPGAGGDDLTGGERLAGGAETLDLVVQLDERASTRTVEAIGLELGDEAPDLTDRTSQLLEHDTSPEARRTIGEVVVPPYTNTRSMCKRNSPGRDVADTGRDQRSAGVGIT